MTKHRVARSFIGINGALAALFLFGCGIRPDVFDRASEAKGQLSYTSAQVDAKLAAVPTGGTEGQALIKASDSDYDTEWGSVATEGGSDEYEPALGNPAGEGYLLASTVDGVRSWVSPGEAEHDAVTLGADADVLLGLSTQQIILDSQSANVVFAGPASGGAADPTFRALEDADIPSAIARDSELPTASSLSVDDLITSSGLAGGATSYGSFTGSILTSDTTAKALFQEVETYLQSLEDGKQDILAEGSFSDGDKTKLDTIEEGAEVNPGVIPQAEAEAGVATTERLITAERLNQAITALTPGISDTKGWDYTVRTEAPTGDALIAGKIYRADNDTWDPISLDGTDDYYVIYTSAGTWIGVIDLTGNLLVASLPADSVIAATIDDGVVLPVHLDASDSPADGEIPVYNLAGENFTWVAASEGGAEANNLESVVTGIANGEILVGTGNGTGAYVTPSGAWTITNAGVASLGNDVVDSAHYAAGSIDLEHMSANSVDSDQYVDGSIDPVHVDKTAAWDFGGASSFELPNSAANDATLSATGQIYIKDTDDAIAVHFGANGSVTGEAMISAIHYFEKTFDPKAVCDGAIDRLAMMTIGGNAPNGISILAWKASFLRDPATEVDLDLKRADALIGVANAAVIDVLDTTNGLAYETTPANINGGTAIANGKVIYLEFGTPYVAEGEQVQVELYYIIEED